MEELAAKLSDRFGGASAFFCNSGTEAVEAAIKWARKATGRAELVALDGSFHGRTMGALSITGQPAKRAPFEPLVPGVRFATPTTLAEHVSDPRPPRSSSSPCRARAASIHSRPRRSQPARSLADEHGALLVFDEVQTGVGRTGEFFAWELHGVKPDALTLAKGLANGLPIGALLVSDDAPTAFVPGDHASTFGGNPVSCAAACAVVDTLDDALLEHVRDGRPSCAQASLRSARSRGARPAARDRARPPGGAGRRGGTRARPRRRHRGRATLRLTPPLTISTDEAAHATRPAHGGAASDDQVRAPGRDPPPRRSSNSSRRRPSWPRRCAARASTPSRRRCRATSRSSGS